MAVEIEITQEEETNWKSTMSGKNMVPTENNVPVSKRTAGDELMRAVLSATAQVENPDTVGGTK